jgi:hypothetical protein
MAVKPEIPEVTPAALKLWRRLQQCSDEDEERELNLALRAELRLKPWHVSPWGAVGRCPWPPSCGGAIYWPYALALRRALNAADSARRAPASPLPGKSSPRAP